MQEVNQNIDQEINQEAVPEAVQPNMRETYPEKDIFRGYEIQSWNFSPRVYKILAVSAIFNIVSLFVFAQSNLLTKKGCDSPFVSTVCQVIDTVYVGTSIFGADTEYADKDFDPTRIAEDSEIIFIDETGETPPISYPAGYFAVANPENFITDENGEKVHISQLNNPLDPTVINPTTVNPTTVTPAPPPSLTQVAPNYPKPSKNPAGGKRPKSPFSIGDDAGDPTTAQNGKDGKDGKATDGKPDDGTVADKDPNKDKNSENPPVPDSKPVEQIEINKRPFTKLAEFVSPKLNFDPAKPDNKIDLKPFKVVLNGTLTKKLIEDEDGKKREVIGFDDKKSTWVKIRQEEAGDPAMVEIAKQAIQAVGDSGFLGHLYNQGLRDLNITLVQTGDQIIIVTESSEQTEERAQTKASGLNGLLALAKSLVKEGSNEQILLASALKTPPKASGKKIIMNFEIPVQVAEELIKRNLASEAQKNKEKAKPNSAAQTVGSEANTGK